MSRIQRVRLVLPRFRNHRGRLTVRNEGRAPAPVLAEDVRQIVLSPGAPQSHARFVQGEQNISGGSGCVRCRLALSITPMIEPQLLERINYSKLSSFQIPGYRTTISFH